MKATIRVNRKNIALEVADLEAACFEVFGNISEECNNAGIEPDGIRVKADGKTIFWNAGYAHYYFAEGRISFGEMLSAMDAAADFGKEMFVKYHL